MFNYHISNFPLFVMASIRKSKITELAFAIQKINLNLKSNLFLTV